MKFANQLVIILLSLFIGVGCKSDPIDLSGKTTVKEKDFLAAFKPMSLPFSVADTNIDAKADTLVIGKEVFLQFYPDSAFSNIMGKTKIYTIHPIGLIDKEKEKYLLFIIKENKKRKRLVVLVANEKNQFLASKELLNNFEGTEYHRSLSINKEPTFLISREKMGKANDILFTRAGWVYNDAGFFMVVINDSNEDPTKTAVINPLDTLPKLNKYSGDYIKDKNNYVSIRDGKDQNTYLFFILFEKSNGACKGELKGEFKLIKPAEGLYSKNGDPCLIDFTFNSNQLKIKEQGSCGNHRGIKCFFDDRYTKKREPRKKKVNKR
ncbi:MAG TPA: hypothetical protein VJA82_09500 [Sediminibacterium sp.]|uniref:hypothetical protein n=1 Tax=Sediminibacterium sp. TaxID=1917865 RepID=UPI0008B16E0B|nr:hypothetical protein [Sediminibacterium sp.]MBT9483117.1 hypothetical protein [Sediminibacterium sp.]OHC85249.1 MAG: hypothetical protein A2472_05585 [Sphingobacteriia bacterium RIFOXYC2_FULL_35_18]OHC89152.1 MAG: hypothetical protein A2546_07625 [Sphingobacteriia bacterium RIFOXYD2_FULL_35_12]HLD53529.1 hypothetical protein [Sediminibacterium sp.]